MKINKTQFGLPIADTSTPINERVLSLARLIEQHGYTPQHPASLGLYTSIEITLFYLKENLPQRVLAQLYHCSQPTISRAINTIINTLNTLLPPAPTPEELDPRLYCVLDGTLVPCYSWHNAPELYNAKRKTTGHNLQILTDQTGNITYISHPFSDKTHDVTALRATGILDTISPDHITADKGYYGVGCDVPIKKKPGQKHLKDYQRRFNHKLGKIRYVIERAIANLKTWRILHTDNRAPLHRIPTIINTITKLLFYQPPE